MTPFQKRRVLTPYRHPELKTFMRMLAKVKSIKFYNEKKEEYEEVDIDSIRILHHFKITDFYLRKFILNNISLSRIIGFKTLFPKLEGPELFEKLWEIVNYPESDDFSKWLYGEKDKCFVTQSQQT